MHGADPSADGELHYATVALKGEQSSNGQTLPTFVLMGHGTQAMPSSITCSCASHVEPLTWRLSPANTLSSRFDRLNLSHSRQGWHVDTTVAAINWFINRSGL